MNTMMQSTSMLGAGVAMWIFWVVVAALLFFFVRACIHHSTAGGERTEQVHRSGDSHHK